MEIDTADQTELSESTFAVAGEPNDVDEHKHDDDDVPATPAPNNHFAPKKGDEHEYSAPTDHLGKLVLGFFLGCVADLANFGGKLKIASKWRSIP